VIGAVSAVELDPFTALVSEQGRLQFSEDNRRAMDMWLLTQVRQYVDVTLTPAGASITEQQRKWYFGPILGAISSATGQPKDDLHLYFKARLLGNPESRVIVLVDKNGCVVDERGAFDEKSITKIGKRRMRNYCDEIRGIAATELDIDIPDPDPNKRS
jgi:hypothetical protein